jgi:DNA mismatch endonuclease (patch repair protein)
MADIYSSTKRSAIMKSVAAKNSKAEVVVRRLLHRLGYRFRLHDANLPGCPDVVLKRFNAVVFIHGCFWHGHGCPKGKLPAENRDFWKAKFRANAERDRRSAKRLRSLGWKVVIVWECELRDIERVQRRLQTALFRRKS